MQTTIKELLQVHGISAVAPLSLDQCTVTRPYLLAREGIEGGTAFLFAIPYYTTLCDDPARNISAYAVAKDYHLFAKELFCEILPILREKFPKNRFAGFADHSPIAELDAACRAGLGVMGKNHLLLTKEHSSFVFLGEIITDAMLSADGVKEKPLCENCGKCLAACPVGLDVTRCLSALTQKKGELDKAEQQAVFALGSCFGCDICQNVCPVTQKARKNGTLYSRIDFFYKDTTPHLTSKMIEAMPDEEFAKRAYSWRGKGVVLRNLHLLEGKEKTE